MTLTKSLLETQIQFQETQKQFQDDMRSLVEAMKVKKANEGNSFTAEGITNSITEFNYNPESGSTFPAYFRRYENIFVNRCSTWTEQQKVSLLLQKLGTEENTKYSNFILPKKPEEVSFEETINCLSSIFGERNSVFHTRYKCLNIVKGEDEDFVTYAGNVNKQCELFRLQDLTPNAFKCLLFVQGLTASRDKDIRSRILTKLEQDPDITLQKITEECQRILNVKHDNKQIEEKDISRVQVVRRKHFKSVKEPSKQVSCYGCGGVHPKKFCYFKDKRCFSCNRVGHKSSFCREKKSEKSNHRVNVVLSKKEIDEGQKRKFVSVRINGTNVILQLDTGSDISIINEKTWKQIGSPPLKKSSRIARGVSGRKLNFKGEATCNLSFMDKTFTSKVYVLQNVTNLFGSDWIVLFDLWTLPVNSFCNKVDVSTKVKDKETKNLMNELKNEFPRVFSEGLGECEKTKVKIELKDDVKPVFRPKRNVPFAALESVNAELERLEDLGVISKISYSDWASPTVYIRKKNNKIRVCADYSTGLNDCLKDHSYPLPSPEDIFAKLNGGKVFSKLDLSEAYLQLKVDDESSELLTINTHNGLYKFNRLPFGVKVAPSIFQQIMDTMLAGLDFAIAYLDDILIKSENNKQHCEHIREVFKRIDEYGFKLSSEKCEFFMTQVKYLGQIINEKGRQPDPERAEAIKGMPSPSNIANLQAFLGLANYYGIYIKNMHDLRAPLNNLLKKGAKWNWSSECENAFQKIKSVLVSDLSLAHFDPKEEIIVASDASDFGIGSVILHRFEDGTTKPIAHASRSLLPAERNYSQIEKESLAIIFGLKKFHRFVHGRKFVLQTDHRPLLSIYGSKKGIPTHTANRLQRWGVILLNYDFKMEFLPSKKLGHADGLSRLIPKFSEPLEDTVIAALHAESEVKGVLCNAIKELPVTLEEIRKRAESDAFIKKIKEQVGLKKRNEKGVSAFSICDNILLYADRVVVPQVLQKRILKEFHVGHPGISRMKNLMRSYCYWPRMDQDIEKIVKTCRGCALAAKAPPIKFNPWPKTNTPWSRLHIDYAGPVNGAYYLVIVDSHTKWPEIFKCKKPTATTTINVLKDLFARFGVPEKIVSDNGTQFTGSDFRNFCKSLTIEHVTTSPYHPRSNGQAERFVDTFKRAIKKNSGMDTDEASLQQFLSVYRITPNPNTVSGKSPAELMFSRKIRSVFDRLLPVRKNTKFVNNKYKNTETNSTRKFRRGEKVFFLVYRGGKEFWEDGVIEKRIGNVLYMVKCKKWEHKRHVNQIRPRYTEEVTEEVPMEVLYDMFDVPAPPVQAAPEFKPRTSKRKRTRVVPFSPDPKRKRY